jgi:hypothetical protein
MIFFLVQHHPEETHYKENNKTKEGMFSNNISFCDLSYKRRGHGSKFPWVEMGTPHIDAFFHP